MKILRGRDIICLSSIDWDFIWQGHQEIMAALAAQGNKVLFVENAGLGAAATIRELPRRWKAHSDSYYRIQPCAGTGQKCPGNNRGTVFGNTGSFAHS